jgi:hypothetical protein
MKRRSVNGFLIEKVRKNSVTALTIGNCKDIFLAMLLELAPKKSKDLPRDLRNTKSVTLEVINVRDRLRPKVAVPITTFA